MRGASRRESSAAEIVAGRIEIDYELIGVVQFTGCAEPGMQLDGGLVCKVDECGGVITKDMRNRAAFFFHFDSIDPVREVIAGFLLKERFSVDPIRVASHRERATFNMGQQEFSDLFVVLDEIALGYRVIREEEFVFVGCLNAIMSESERAHKVRSSAGS